MSTLNSDARDARIQTVIKALNTARAMELNAIHQYMHQHYNLDALDYGDFAAKLKLIAIDEMRHAENFAERIRELEGVPCTGAEGEVVKGQDVRDIFVFDANSEDGTMETYNRFLNLCRENGDSVSARLFETIIDEELAHHKYFSDTHNHIVRLGDAYLSKIAGTPASTGAASKGFVNQPTA